MDENQKRPEPTPNPPEILIHGIPYNGEPLVRYSDVAKYTGLSEGCLRTLVSKNQIPHYKIGKPVRFRMSEIDKWLANRKQGYTAKK
ncbi:MAG: hypothetical protein CVV44_04155 [Spirochaetae bacterium HGW-Spirochaetae-1]|nr:MAG: hypothetical protein CVV44_04155 [Spirochaetae bacterium HGW-Spirochaetae-1]